MHTLSFNKKVSLEQIRIFQEFKIFEFVKTSNFFVLLFTLTPTLNLFISTSMLQNLLNSNNRF